MFGRPLPLWAFFVIGFGALVTGIGLGLSALDEVELDCIRERCTVTHSFPVSSVETSLAHVRTAKKTVTGTKAKSTHLELVDERGEQLRLLTIRRGDAAKLVADMQALLAGELDHVHSDQGREVALFGISAVLIVAGLGWLVVGTRRARGRGAPPRPAYVPPPPAHAQAWNPRRWMLMIAGMSVVGVVANMVLLSAAKPVGGTLKIEAQQRCEYRGVTLLPGTVTEQVVDPGEHTIRVWTPDVPGKWTEHRVTVALDGAVTFVCAPP